MAQTLARHCDIRLTMGIYSHVTMQEQTEAIESLPGPPERKPRDGEGEEQQPEAA